MAIICENYNLLYIMVGGTGCTSIGKVLRKQLGGSFLPETHFIDGRTGKSLEQKHNTLKQLIEFGLISIEESENFFKFANVRNPFDVYATIFARFHGPTVEDAIKDKNSWVYVDQSGYRHSPKKIKKTLKHLERNIDSARNLGFDIWLERRIGLKARLKVLAKQRLSKSNPAGVKDSYRALDGLDDFIRFESLEEDFNRILRKVGVETHVQLPNSNPTEGKKPYQQYYSPKSKALIELVFSDELERFGYSF